MIDILPGENAQSGTRRPKFKEIAGPLPQVISIPLCEHIVGRPSTKIFAAIVGLFSYSFRLRDVFLLICGTHKDETNVRKLLGLGEDKTKQ
jgi:hypothetical protein